MEKKYALAFMMLPLAMAALAQPTITGSSNPVPGDALTMQNGGQMATPATGASATWNYATAIFNGPAAQLVFAAPGSGVPAGTTLMETGTPGLTSYLKADATALSLVGLATDYGTMDCADAMVQMPYPFTFNSTLTDPYSCSGQSAGYQYSRSGSTQFTGSGFGTLILPYGTVSNVLLISVSQSMSDDFIDDDLVDMEYSLNLFMFAKPGAKTALLTVSTTQNLTSGATTYASRMLDPNSLGVSEALANSIGVELVPNPASGSVEVRYGVGARAKLAIDVLDMAGRVVISQARTVHAAGIQRDEINIAALAQGVYMVRITDGEGGYGVKQLIVQ